MIKLRIIYLAILPLFAVVFFTRCGADISSTDFKPLAEIPVELNKDGEVNLGEDGEGGDIYESDSLVDAEGDPVIIWKDKNGVVRYLVCHITGDGENDHVVWYNESARDSHFAHGDYYGYCIDKKL